MARFADPAIARRLLSALVLIPVALAAVHLGRPWFDGLVVLAGGIMIWEWSRMVLGAFRDSGQRLPWLALGVLYVAIPCLAILWLRADPVWGQATLFWLLGLVVAADCGAYFVGRSLGGPRLAPRISPAKTWAGLLGAVLAAATTGLVAALLLDFATPWSLMIISSLLAIVEQLGDLVESAFKRRFGVKDSGRIIPGHGGVLDRVDGLMAVGVAAAFLSYLGGGSVLAWL